MVKKDEALAWISSIARSFQRSRALLTAVELDVFTALGRGFDTPGRLASSLGINERGTRGLLRALAAMGFLAKSGDGYRLKAASRLLVDEGRSTSRKALLHAAAGWERWSRLTEAVRRGGLKRRGGEPRGEKRWRDRFIAAMESSSRQRARPVARATAPILRRCSALIDLGGGSGGYARAFLEINPAMEITVFDDPGVLPLTRRYLGPLAGRGGRVRLVGGDFLRDDFGRGYDAAFLSSIIHIYSPATNRKLLKAVRRALQPGGWVIIQDFILDDGETRPVEAALFGLHMLVSTREGGTYTRGEIRDWLSSAGFGEIRRIRLDGPSSLVTARRPLHAG